MNASEIRVNSGFLWKVSFISGLGGVLYGYDMGIIAAALIFIRGSFALSTTMQEVVVSIVLVGAMLGAIIGGSVADRIGRRATLLWGGGLFIFGSILAPLSPNVATLVIARAFLGLAIGFTSVTAPVYISELSPPQTRGRLISLYQLALTLGIVLANLVGYWLAAGQAWRMMFGLGGVPAALLVVLVLSLPESPGWLFTVGSAEQAKDVLRTYTDEAGACLLQEDIEAALQAKVDKRWSSLWAPSVRGALLIAVALLFCSRLRESIRSFITVQGFFLLRGLPPIKMQSLLPSSSLSRTCCLLWSQ